MIEIFKLIKDNDKCRKILGTKPTRFYPFAEAPERPTTPYAVWQLIGGEPLNRLTCGAIADHLTVQIDAFAARAQDARDSANAIREALEKDNRCTVTRWAIEERERETGLYRVNFDIDFINNRS